MSLALDILKWAGLSLLSMVSLFAFAGLVGLPFALRERALRRRRSTRGSDAARIRGLMKRMARDTLLLIPAKEPGFSKLGGNPELPVGLAWPAGRKRPRSFVCQIDLTAFRAHGGPEWLPTEGRLYAFCDEDGWGFSDETAMLHSLGLPGPPKPPPPGVASHFPERRVAFLVARSVPSTDWLDADLGDLDDADMDVLAGIHDEAFGDEPQHRIGGYPSEIQGGQMQVICELMRRGLESDSEATSAIERAARQWRMLLQIDSDPALKMNWGDHGRLYVFIREKDARAGDFTKTVALSQSY